MRTPRQCVRCVMDTTDPDIEFDEAGVCNHCKGHERRVSAAPFSQPGAEAALDALIRDVKAGRGKEYDVLIGLSGGVDSSYLALKAVQLGLRPLAVHFDNGWNSELAVKNIENIVKTLDIDLITYVIDWPEFRDIQRSFFKANVIDIEMVTDHAIFAALYRISRDQGISVLLSGTNAATESIMPRTWQHLKFDLLNLQSIQRRFGTRKIRNFPTLSIWKMGFLNYSGIVKSKSLLNYIPYRKLEAIEQLTEQLGWRNYGGKHHESAFTKYYQAHILPTKFGVDKRKAHLSDLIMNGEVSRADAVSELAKPLYAPDELAQDGEYVRKKLGFTEAEFEAYLAAPPVSHYSYPSYARLAQHMVDLHRRMSAA